MGLSAEKPKRESAGRNRSGSRNESQEGRRASTIGKTEISKWLDAKEEAIQRLKRQLAQQQEEKQQ